MRSRKFFKMLLPFAVIAVVYFLGSAPDDAIFDLSQPNVPADADQLERYIAEKESRHKLKPDNEARIVWFDSTRQKTPFSIIYLHGFSASQKEGDPVHLRLAKEFGCNLFLPRLSDHGVDTTEALQLFTADRAWNSAKEALAIGRAIGHKVILLGTSTGASLALKLAAEYPDQVHALINMSPNIAINHPAAFILNDPWGLQISRL